MTSAATLRAALGACAALLLAGFAGPESLAVDADETCAGCHAGLVGDFVRLGDERPGFVELEDGVRLSVEVDPLQVARSVHGREVACEDCHRGHGDYPHPAPRARTLREHQLEAAEACARCHYAEFTRVVDGIHYAALSAGNPAAPTCVDCHGAHDVKRPGEPRAEVPDRCARCHADVAETYAASVHGEALAAGNLDVPVCTDCHGAHAIVDPTTKSFHVGSYKACGRCHGDAEIMARNELSPTVVSTYLDDFHGRSNHLYAETGQAPDRPMATCTDCHGIHDIARFDKSGGLAAVEARVGSMCRRCHEDSPDKFAGAWLSHQPPTAKTAPAVWAVTWGYRLLIPAILLGLVMHILLHLWRTPTHQSATE